MSTWVRVRDKSTGHEYDLHVDDVRVREGRGVEVLKNYPPNETTRPRPPKHRVAKSGSKKAEQPPADREQQAEQQPAENTEES